MKWWFRLTMMVAALGILYVSFTRAGLEKVNEDEKYDRLRKISISYDYGLEKELRCYKLPESRTLPNSPVYFIKKVRDDLWIRFSRNEVDKARISLLVADKKMEEAIVMYEKHINSSLLKKNIEEASKRIEIIQNAVNTMNKNDLEVKKIKQKVDQTNWFYRYIIERISLNKKIVRCDE